MSKFSFAIFGLAAVLAAANSFAGDVVGKPGIGLGGPGRAISFNELRERCLHPESFVDVQRAPQNVRLQCMDQRRTWTAAAPGEVSLPTFRRVTTGVFADKFFVNAEQREIPVYAKTGSCHRFREIDETVTIERALTCAEILSIKGDVSDFCASLLDTAKGSNPKLVEARETGQVIDTCGLGSVQNNGKPGPK